MSFTFCGHKSAVSKLLESYTPRPVLGYVETVHGQEIWVTRYEAARGFDGFDDFVNLKPRF